MSSIDYHLAELEIALSKSDPRRILPDIHESEKAILDIGCGVGQSFLALECTNRICVGLDVDEEAIKYGMENYGRQIQFVLADAQRLPFPAESFDFVFARVSLPYTNVPRVIREARRVLRRDGRVWLSLHTQDRALRYLREAAAASNVKQLIHGSYVLLNGYLLKYFGKTLPFVNGRYESWQDAVAMKALLRKCGFEAADHKIGLHTVVEGRLNRLLQAVASISPLFLAVLNVGLSDA